MEEMNKTIFLSDSNLKNLKCSFCKKYLSIGPVHSSEGKYICGRCPSKGERNLAYEELAKYMMFPCSHKNCTKKLPWDSKHEEECLHRKILCPFVKCESRYEIENIETHFDEFHKAFKYVDTLKMPETYVDDMEDLYQVVCLLMDKGKPYIVFISTDRTTWKSDFFGIMCAFDVHSVLNKPDRHSRYKVTITFTDDIHVLTTSTNNHKIDLFNEKSHTIKNVNYTEYPCIGNLIWKYDNNTMNLSLNIYDSAEAGQNPNCPLCYKKLCPQVFKCVTGHYICNDCKDNAIGCPFCADFDGALWEKPGLIAVETLAHIASEKINSLK